MEWRLLATEEVITIHDAVLNPGELEGLAKDKSLEAALSRIEFRINYGMISDVYDLAAMYAVAISQAHAFNDANKRTAYAAMEFVLLSHEVLVEFDTKVIGDITIEAAQGKLDEDELAAWLRTH